MAGSIVHASDLHLPAGWSLPSHSHLDLHELVLVVEGVIETRIDGQVLINPPGTMKYHPRGVPHAERALDGLPPRLLLLCFETRGPIPAPSAWPLHGPDRRGRLLLLLEWLIEIGSGADIRHETLSRSLFIAIEEECTRSQAPEHPLVARIRSHIASHITGPIDLDQLATVAAMSRFHFSRVFRRLAGVSPMTFVRLMRVEAARTLLLTSAGPLRAIASAVGFSDEFQFSRVFRHVTGRSPGSLRRVVHSPSMEERSW